MEDSNRYWFYDNWTTSSPPQFSKRLKRTTQFVKRCNHTSSKLTLLQLFTIQLGDNLPASFSIANSVLFLLRLSLLMSVLRCLWLQRSRKLTQWVGNKKKKSPKIFPGFWRYLHLIEHFASQRLKVTRAHVGQLYTYTYCMQRLKVKG